MKYTKIQRNTTIPSGFRNVAYLVEDNWDDYTYKTTFSLVVFDENGARHDIGVLKIGFKNQQPGTRTTDSIPNIFEILGGDYFSLGQDIEYYKNIRTKLSENLGSSILQGLNDIAYIPKYYELAEKEPVFSTSLLRGVSKAAIKGQFLRVLNGGAPLTNFDFIYKKQPSEKYSGIELAFHVKPNSRPSTNVHAIIGRNGVGKTTLLNNMVDSIVSYNAEVTGGFYATNGWSSSLIGKDYFSSLVSVSFSAFDPFIPPQERSDPTQGTCYYYLGLKNSGKDVKDAVFKSPTELRDECVTSLLFCLGQPAKKERWLKAISILESDENFADMDLGRLANLPVDMARDIHNVASSTISRMSSGHAIVLLTITRLIEKVEEKTLILIDEPESHLHPPLLSAFIRALSDLLFDRNGVAIIATHSPVILQEVPKSCAWIITRSRLATSVSRPEQETFGENVGILTRDVFGLEVMKSGFHALLAQSVATGASFEQIIKDYDGQLGFEGQAVLRALIASRDSGAGIQ